VFVAEQTGHDEKESDDRRAAAADPSMVADQWHDSHNTKNSAAAAVDFSRCTIVVVPVIAGSAGLPY
jgi:hypothetical protein